MEFTDIYLLGQPLADMELTTCHEVLCNPQCCSPMPNEMHKDTLDDAISIRNICEAGARKFADVKAVVLKLFCKITFKKVSKITNFDSFLQMKITLNEFKFNCRNWTNI